MSEYVPKPMFDPKREKARLKSIIKTDVGFAEDFVRALQKANAGEPLFVTSDHEVFEAIDELIGAEAGEIDYNTVDPSLIAEKIESALS